MANQFTQQQIESILGLQAGQAQGGYAQNLINNDPAAAAKYQNAITAQTQAPYGTPNFNNGVRPTQIEEQNVWERTALEQMGRGAPQINSGQYRDPYADQLLQQAGGYAGQAADIIGGASQGINQADIESFYNPYQQQVVDTTLAGLTREGEDLRAKMLSNLGTRGAASFGSSITSDRMNDLQRDLTADRGNTQARLQYQGYNDAVSNAFQNQQSMQQGGSTLGGLASNLGGLATRSQDIGTNAFNQGLQQSNLTMTGQDRQLQAGQTQRDYNQGVADVAYNDYYAQQQYPLTQAQNTSNLVTGLSGKGTYNNYSVPSGTGQLLSGISAAGNIIGGIGGQPAQAPQPQNVPTTPQQRAFVS